ncbi:unnamed protein product, partial [Iphiclides podalirius]
MARQRAPYRLTDVANVPVMCALQPYAWLLWTSGLVLLILIWTLYAVTLKSALRNWRESRTNVVTVLSVYPLVATASYVAIVVPRATVVAEAVAQEVVMVAMYQFYCLIIAECGGVSQFIRRAGDSRLETRVMPCCCWPCCFIPRPQINKRCMSCLRILVLQIPIVQAVLYVLILVLWAEDMMLYRRCLVYIQCFVAVSILSGIWGVVMCVRAAESMGNVFRPRYFALQLVLIIVKLQYSLAKLLSDSVTLPCITSLHPTVLVNVTQNTVTIFEMLLLSIWAWRLYGVAHGKGVNNIQKIGVTALEEGNAALDVKPTIDGVDNKSFNVIRCHDKQ